MNEKKECIIILAGGKASNKPRHLDWLWTKFLRVIDIPIKKSLQVSNNVFICIDESNIALIRYVKKLQGIKSSNSKWSSNDGYI